MIRTHTIPGDAMMYFWFQGAVLFSFGAAAYPLIELIYRRYTHWTMALVGGLCMFALYCIHYYWHDRPLPLRCLLGALSVTAVEFVSGLFINLLWGMNVWNYSHMPFQLYGQICLPYTILWFFLCIPAFAVCNVFFRLFGTESKPRSCLL